MTLRVSRDALQAVALHGVALAILLWPLVGIEFVPMVDLPGHLAITRVLDDVLHAKYEASLQLNVDPVHKPAYVLLYAVFAVLPKSKVGPVAVGVIVALSYAAVCYCISSLGARAASSPLVVSLALLISMFCFSSLFFWGLIPFLLSIPPALIAYGSYLEASGVVDGAGRAPSRTNAHALAFIAAAVLAHVVHPLSSFFLAIMVASAAVAAVVFALVRRGANGAAATAHLWSIAWPLVVWASAVVTLHLVTAPAGHELDLARSASAFAAPFHGVAAARAFLARIPIELGLLPTRNQASTFIAYPVAVALFLAASCTVALVALLIPRSKNRQAPASSPATTLARSPVLRLATVFVLSALLFFFLRHDIVRINMRALWFQIRGPGFLVFFFAVLAAALILRSLETSRSSRLVPLVIVVGALAIASEQSAVLRVHFVAFDQKVRAFFHGDIPDHYFRSQPFAYGDHIRAYNCYFEDTCYDQSRLFFSIYPADATIYPVSRIRTPPGAGDHERGNGQ